MRLRSTAEPHGSSPNSFEKIENDVFHFVLDNTKIRNAICAELLNFIEAAANKCHAHDQIKAMVIYASSPIAFSSGANLKERRSMSLEEGLETENSVRRVFNLLSKVQVPTFSLIDGHCMGEGLEIALATDFRIVAKSAKLSFPETRLGLIPGWTKQRGRYPKTLKACRTQQL